MVRFLLNCLPGTDIVLLGLLPRGFSKTGFALPSIYSGAIANVNEQLRCGWERTQLEQAHLHRVPADWRMSSCCQAAGTNL